MLSFLAEIVFGYFFLGFILVLSLFAWNYKSFRVGMDIKGFLLSVAMWPLIALIAIADLFGVLGP